MFLRAAFLAFQYAPVPAHWQQRFAMLVWRLAGARFKGRRHYELWLRRAGAPASPGVPRDARGRPRVLVIDHYVPQPDRDAGSRSTWCVLRALQSMGLAVTFWPHDLLYDPQYVPMMQREGIEVFWGEPLRGRFGAWFARHGKDFDYVLLSRPLVARDVLADVRRHSRAKVLYYGHDLHHARLAREYALTGFAPLRWESAIIRRIEERLWRTADVVYYPSSEETELVRRTVPGVQAWTLPLYYYDDAPVASSGPAQREGIVFVAGFGHGPNTDAATWLVEEIMPRVWDSVPSAHLSLVGSNPTAQVRALAGPRVTVTGYVSDEELLRFYRNARVAVVPLRVGAGMKGKIVEALHHGVPLVTTPVGAQGLEGLSPLVPVSDEPAALAAAIVALLKDDAKWDEVARVERDYAREHFSREAMVEALARGLTRTGDARLPTSADETRMR